MKHCSSAKKVIRQHRSLVQRKDCALLEQLQSFCTNRNAATRQESRQLVFNPREEGLTLLRRKAAEKMPVCQLHIRNAHDHSRQHSLCHQLKHIGLYPPGGPMTYFNIMTWQQLPPTLHEPSTEIRVLLASSVPHTSHITHALWQAASLFILHKTAEQYWEQLVQTNMVSHLD